MRSPIPYILWRRGIEGSELQVDAKNRLEAFQAYRETMGYDATHIKQVDLENDACDRANAQPTSDEAPF